MLLHVGLHAGGRLCTHRAAGIGEGWPCQGWSGADLQDQQSQSWHSGSLGPDGMTRQAGSGHLHHCQGLNAACWAAWELCLDRSVQIMLVTVHTRLAVCSSCNTDACCMAAGSQNAQCYLLPNPQPHPMVEQHSPSSPARGHVITGQVGCPSTAACFRPGGGLPWGERCWHPPAEWLTVHLLPQQGFVPFAANGRQCLAGLPSSATLTSKARLSDRQRVPW